VVDPVQIFLASSLINMQLAYVGGLKFRALGPRSLMIGGVTDPIETRLSARITVPKLEVIRQTVLIL